MPGFDAGISTPQLSGFTPANLGTTSITSPGSVDPLSFLFSQLSSDIQFHRQKKLMDKQYQQALEQWQRQNEYDSPLAQMERLRAAGLNPDLIYSQMGNGQAAQLMSTEQNLGENDLGAALTRGQAQRIARDRLEVDQALAQSQLSVNESLANKYEADAEQSRSSASRNYRWIKSQDIQDMLSGSKIKLNDAEAVQLAYRCNEISQHIELMKSQAAYQDALTAIARVDEQFKADYWRADIQELRSRANLNYRQCEKLEQSIMELRDSWEARLKSLQHQERVDYGAEVMAMAEAAVNRWQYNLSADGDPLPSGGAAVYKSLDMALSLIGKIFHINANEFTNHSSFTEKRWKYGKTHIAD